MAFVLGTNSKARLATVHPDMQRVVARAITLSAIDFAVVQGRRTRDEQCKLYGQGRTAAQCKAAGVPINYAKPLAPKVTWTMSSKHLSGDAVDLAAFVEGAINWNDTRLYAAIAAAMKHAAAIEGVPISWGGDWIKTKDYPHFELVR